MFIGTGAWCSAVLDFERARSGSREKQKGVLMKEKLKSIEGEGECLVFFPSYTRWNLEVVLISMWLSLKLVILKGQI